MLVRLHYRRGLLHNASIDQRLLAKKQMAGINRSRVRNSCCVNNCYALSHVRGFRGGHCSRPYRLSIYGTDANTAIIAINFNWILLESRFGLFRQSLPAVGMGRFYWKHDIWLSDQLPPL